jgi:hypothetical protein
VSNIKGCVAGRVERERIFYLSNNKKSFIDKNNYFLLKKRS